MENRELIDHNGKKLMFVATANECDGCYFGNKKSCPECDGGIFVELPDFWPWIEGYPEEEGWFVIEYVCTYEPYKGKRTYRTVRRFRDELMSKAIWEEGGLSRNDDVWQPSRYRRLDG